MEKREPISVAELTDLIKGALEEGFSKVAIKGEISNWRPSASGHVYFTLKDEKAQIQAVMFRGRASSLAFEPRDGALVVAQGSVSVYAPRGQYQIIVERMEAAGVGDILARLDALKRKLAAEGLFDDARKREIPRFPSRVCIVTSPTGAAIRDILNVLGRRNSRIRVLVLPASVQGADAPGELAARIRQANLHSLGDVLIVARGGGSIEDLLAFSDESVVRAVASSAIPVISAVGHEIDWALTDFAADLRAPTPSAAAELVSESLEGVERTVELLIEAIRARLMGLLERTRLSLSRFSPRALRDMLEMSLRDRVQRFDHARDYLVEAMKAAFQKRKSAFATTNATLLALDPHALLARGYAVVRKGQVVIKSSEQLQEGDMVTIAFSSGGANAEIKETAQGTP